VDEAERPDLSAEFQRIGQTFGHIRITDAAGTALLDESSDVPDHAAALQALLAWLGQHRSSQGLDAVGHRVVHGGSAYSEPQLITDELVATLRQLVPIDPMHLPQAIAAIEVVGRAYPGIPQVACFDTAFHRHMPRVAQMYALPRHLWDEGVLRYGFHGLSYEYIMQELHRLDSRAATGRVVIAHLGNGASMAAVQNGVGIDTTMGFTPTGGLVMGTRTGDLDPGVLLYLLESKGISASAVNTLVNRQSGLLGVSGISADMHDLLEKEPTNPRAAEAVALFCYQAKKFLGALAAALGGLETLVCTAGIGEHAAPVRERICSGLEFLGIHLDPDRNANHAPIISREGSPVTVRVMHTDEDLMIARHIIRLVRQGEGRHVHL
jgi:acetate kinase